jgi:hypothetical protein
MDKLVGLDELEAKAHLHMIIDNHFSSSQFSVPLHLAHILHAER